MSWSTRRASSAEVKREAPIEPPGERCSDDPARLESEAARALRSEDWRDAQRFAPFGTRLRLRVAHERRPNSRREPRVVHADLSQGRAAMSRAGCFTRGWQGRMRLSRGVDRTARASKVSSRELLELLRQHHRRMPTFLPVGTLVQTNADWSGSRDRVVATTVCDRRTGLVTTLVQFAWEVAA